jgi:hypothetical protein
MRSELAVEEARASGKADDVMMMMNKKKKKDTRVSIK